MASVLTRLASMKARKHGTKLLYTAHGFHFFKGASMLHWALFYPVEILLSKYTDAIICINPEDFDLISTKGNKSCAYYLIPGIGVSNSRFFEVSIAEKTAIRVTNNFATTDFLLVYAAEYIGRKNHDFIIQAIKDNIDKVEGIKILFAGKGVLEDKLMNAVKQYHLEEYIYFLGFRSDIDQIYKMSDVGISSSKQEGLGINLVEEMMCGLPVIATVDRGHSEVVDHEVNGFLIAQNDHNQFVAYLLQLKNDKQMRAEFSRQAKIKADKFELRNSLKVMAGIYERYL